MEIRYFLFFIIYDDRDIPRVGLKTISKLKISFFYKFNTGMHSVNLELFLVLIILL